MIDVLPPPHAGAIAHPMSRFKRVRNWPDNLKTMPLEELRKEL
jgi:hypothetical protein